MPKPAAKRQTIKFEFYRTALSFSPAFVMTAVPDNPILTAVLVGCGGMSRTWIDALTAIPEIRLVGLVDVNEEAPRKLTAERHLGEVVCSSDLDAVLTKTRPDLLLVCSIPEAHEANILAGLRHGCHVLTEKPLTSTMAEARHVVAAAKKAGRLVAVTQNYRYRRSIRSVKAFLDSGAIGRVTGLDVDFYIGAHFEGFRAEMEHVLLIDMSIHTFDMARYLAGATPEAVLAHEWNPSNSWLRHGGSTTAIFKFSNGVVFNYRGSWCSQGFDTGWDGHWRILGEKGAVWWKDDEIRAEVATGSSGFIREKESVPVPLLPPETADVPEVSKTPRHVLPGISRLPGRRYYAAHCGRRQHSEHGHGPRGDRQCRAGKVDAYFGRVLSRARARRIHTFSFLRW